MAFATTNLLTKLCFVFVRKFGRALLFRTYRPMVQIKDLHGPSKKAKAKKGGFCFFALFTNTNLNVSQLLRRRQLLTQRSWVRLRSCLRRKSHQTHAVQSYALQSVAKVWSYFCSAKVRFTTKSAKGLALLTNLLTKRSFVLVTKKICKKFCTCLARYDKTQKKATQKQKKTKKKNSLYLWVWRESNPRPTG